MNNSNSKDVTEILLERAREVRPMKISGITCEINVFFNCDRFNKYFNFYEESNNFRNAFARVAYLMYSNKNFEIESTSNPLCEQEFINASDEELVAIINIIVKTDNDLKHEYYDIERLDPFEKFYIANRNIRNRNIKTTEKFIKAIEKFLTSKSHHDDLSKYGWFYLNALPEEMLSDISERTNELKKEEVDRIIVEYFRQDECSELIKIVESWETLPFFHSRKVVYDQVLIAHTQSLYNLSVTVLTLHMEGVIHDFALTALGEPKWKPEKNLERIVEIIKNHLNVLDRLVLSNVSECICKALSENFDKANPDATSNKSRHKIAHGYVTDIETEVNSLKCFLYTNELWRAFSFIITIATQHGLDWPSQGVAG